VRSRHTWKKSNKAQVTGLAQARDRLVKYHRLEKQLDLPGLPEPRFAGSHVSKGLL
jgi:hypothetical protein